MRRDEDDYEAARARRDDPGPLYIQSARRAPRGYVTSRRARVRSDQAVIYRLAPGRPRTTAWRQGFRVQGSQRGSSPGSIYRG